MIEGKKAYLSIERPDELQRIAHALSSPVRLSVLRLLGEKSRSIGEIAQALSLPMSTAALAVKVLEDAELITTEQQPGIRGSLKLCSRKLDQIDVDLDSPKMNHENCLTITMPIGGYSNAENIKPTCGLASEQTLLGSMDIPRAFYLPDRFNAQLIWFRQGMLEYLFSSMELADMEVDWLELSFEACSEAPMYRNPWPSDICVEINGKRIGVWTSPCDCGGRHGRITPDWWSELSTQFGFLKLWRVDHTGSYLDGEPVSDITLDQLNLNAQPFFRVRIGVAEDSECVGGMNLFGQKFGDYPQGLQLRVGYRLHGAGENASGN